ncbi:MAG TPA: YbhB/YbcL family Raf kinase inhibitor-like protein [Candidatus Lustribacter sp.]
MQTSYRVLVLAFAVLFAGLPAAARAAGFVISANGEADNALLPAAMGFDKMSSDGVHSCGGTNKAPGFSWENPPAKTTSYAILEVDPDGRAGLGVNHWVIYNIPGAATGISAAEIAAGKYTPGRGTGEFVGYRGPCPPLGDAPHHYIVTLFALDAPPAFATGLDHDGVVAAMKGHVLGATTTIMRFQRK